MTLKVGQPVTIRIKRPSRWTSDHVAAFNGVTGFIKEIKPERGDNNILVSFPNSIYTDRNKHYAFHFLAEDLTPDTEPVTTVVKHTLERSLLVCNMPALYQFVESHGYTLTWDTSNTPYMRGCIWTQGDALAGHFTVTNYGVNLSIDKGELLEWW